MTHRNAIPVPEVNLDLYRANLAHRWISDRYVSNSNFGMMTDVAPSQALRK
jgi:hypothetical protein